MPVVYRKGITEKQLNRFNAARQSTNQRFRQEENSGIKEIFEQKLSQGRFGFIFNPKQVDNIEQQGYQLLQSIQAWDIKRIQFYALLQYPRIFSNITHIEFNDLKYLSLQRANVVSLQAISFIDMPVLSHLNLNQNFLIRSLKPLSKMNIKSLDKINLQACNQLPLSELQHLSKLNIGKIQSKFSLQNKPSLQTMNQLTIDIDNYGFEIDNVGDGYLRKTWSSIYSVLIKVKAKYIKNVHGINLELNKRKGKYQVKRCLQERFIYKEPPKLLRFHQGQFGGSRHINQTEQSYVRKRQYERSL